MIERNVSTGSMLVIVREGSETYLKEKKNNERRDSSVVRQQSTESVQS